MGLMSPNLVPLVPNGPDIEGKQTRPGWQIDSSCKIVVNFVVTLVIVMPPFSLSHKLANKRKNGDHSFIKQEIIQ